MSSSETDIYEKLDTYIKLRPTKKIKKGLDGKYHYIYVTIYLEDKRFYIGKHTSWEYKSELYIGSGKYLARVINKYGSTNFYNFIVSYHNSSEEAYLEEECLITKDIINSKDSFNFKLGGSGWGVGDRNVGTVLYKNGVHPLINNNPMTRMAKEGWVGRESSAIISVKKGTHKWLRGNFDPTKHRSVIASKNGTHNWLDYNNHPSVVSSRNGTHKWKGEKNPSVEWSKKGLSPATIASKNGTHWSKNILPWNNSHSNYHSRLAWWYALEIREINQVTGLVYSALAKFCTEYFQIKEKYKVEFTRQTMFNILRKEEDWYNTYWKDFKN